MLKPEDLVGTWEMVEYYLEKDGERVYPLGEDCKGFLMYTPDGYVSAQQMAAGRPAYASGDLHDGTPEEMAAAARLMGMPARSVAIAGDTERATELVRQSLRPDDTLLVKGSRFLGLDRLVEEVC